MKLLSTCHQWHDLPIVPHASKSTKQKSAIHQATVNFATEVLHISYDANQTNRDEVMAWVAKQALRLCQWRIAKTNTRCLGI